MISEELIEEILDDSKRGRFLDENTLERMILSCIESSDSITQENFRGVEYLRLKNPKMLAGVSNGTIKIDYYKLKSYITSHNYQSALKENLLLLSCIMHEIEHLKEPYKLKYHEPFEQLLLKISDMPFLDELVEKEWQEKTPFPAKLYTYLFHKKQHIQERQEKSYSLYKSFYNLTPAEKIADIDSADLLFQSFQNYSDQSSPVESAREFIQSLSLYYRLQGYREQEEKMTIPLKEYVQHLNCTPLLREFPFYRENDEDFLEAAREVYSLEERMRYSLPISKEECEKTKKLIHI